MACGTEIAAHIAGLVGVVLLAFPAFYVAHYAYLVASLTRTRANLHPGWEQAITKTEKALAGHRDSWDWKRFLALVAGTLAAGSSYVLGLVAAVIC